MNPGAVQRREREDRAARAAVAGMATFTAADVAARAGVSDARARDILRRWEGRQMAHLHAVAKGGRKVYAHGTRGEALSPTRIALRAERGADAQQNLWAAMRRLKRFTPMDLVVAADDPAAPVTEAAARAYCQSLLRGEYLRVLQRAQPGVRPATYLLARPTGEAAPVERRVRALWDPNEGALTYVAGLGVTA